jgi:hypothetical protein
LFCGGVLVFITPPPPAAPGAAAKGARARDRSLLGEEYEAADAASGKVGFALFLAENVEMRVRASASCAGRPVDLAASQVVDRRFERTGEADQKPTWKRDCRAALEIIEVAGIHAGASCDFLMRQAQLLPAMGDTTGEIAGGRICWAHGASSMDAPR